MVRPTSNRDALPSEQLEFAVATLEDPEALERAVAGVDAVIHLASLLKVPWRADFQSVNVGGTRALLEACVSQASPPTVVFISSLAAAGPAEDGGERTEEDPPSPVSIYGRAKYAAEQLVDEFADRVSSTILRPPMVYGPGDTASLPLFQTAAGGWHFTPRFRAMRLSTVFVDNLCAGIELALLRGERRPPSDTGSSSQGIYFVANDEVTTYGELGRKVGGAVGRDSVKVLRLPGWLSFLGACVSEAWARLRGRAQILNRDKWREATAGDWVCCANRAKEQLGWSPIGSLDENLRRTADAYRQSGQLD